MLRERPEIGGKRVPKTRKSVRKERSENFSLDVSGGREKGTEVIG